MEIDTAVLAEHGIDDDAAGLIDKIGGRNGGFETVKCADHSAKVGNRPVTARGC